MVDQINLTVRLQMQWDILCLLVHSSLVPREYLPCCRRCSRQQWKCVTSCNYAEASACILSSPCNTCAVSLMNARLHYGELPPANLFLPSPCLPACLHRPPFITTRPSGSDSLGQDRQGTCMAPCEFPCLAGLDGLGPLQRTDPSHVLHTASMGAT